jgi:hypothetical protein
LRKLWIVGIAAALGINAACSREPEDAPFTKLPFNVARCLSGLAVAQGEVIQIPPGGCIASPKRTYALLMQPSGSLELIPVDTRGSPGKAVWTTGTHAPRPGGAVGVFQTDGNLVVYDLASKPLWASSSVFPVGAYALAVTDEGEVMVRSSEGKNLWSSRAGLIPQ